MLSSTPESAFRVAYYVSGHGFGHATRVSAIVEAILDLNTSIEITIVSTAPSYVFNCLSKGAGYRYAEIDPVIAQPVAYAVDRRQSLEVLRGFLAHRNSKLMEEALWISESKIDCVLSDAVFLACAAANLACVPSALITNFTFDSNWSWLSSDIPHDTPWAIIANHLDMHHLMDGIPDDPSAYEPLLESDLAPLVEQMRRDYSCADCLFLLPGAIPFPSFSVDTPLPATQWVSHESKSFQPPIAQILNQYRESPESVEFHPTIPYPPSYHRGARSRSIIPAPLIVRHPSSDAFTLPKRKSILDLCGVPKALHNATKTRVLIVSFGGQKFKRPGSGSNTPSTNASPEMRANHELSPAPKDIHILGSQKAPRAVSDTHYRPTPHRSKTYLRPISHSVIFPRPRQMSAPPRIVTPTHLFIPGAPGPVPNPISPLVGPQSPRVEMSLGAQVVNKLEENVPRLLPPGWIAIICGGSSWNDEDLLPEDLFIAPRDIYMPDLMVVGDVLLGKLGYGTVSEAIDSATPFMYVPRPAICEEMGLKLLLEQEGVGVEISREKYESGDWADLVEEAWTTGQSLKEQRRELGTVGRDARRKDTARFAGTIVDWMRDQQRHRIPNELTVVTHASVSPNGPSSESLQIPAIQVNP